MTRAATLRLVVTAREEEVAALREKLRLVAEEAVAHEAQMSAAASFFNEMTSLKDQLASTTTAKEEADARLAEFISDAERQRMRAQDSRTETPDCCPLAVHLTFSCARRERESASTGATA